MLVERRELHGRGTGPGEPVLDAARPAGLSPAVVRRELRRRNGFSGVTVTDALVTAARNGTLPSTDVTATVNRFSDLRGRLPRHGNVAGFPAALPHPGAQVREGLLEGL
ncbi:hypothetical protein [Amycolatopsis sp. NBC_00438]|uniref:hypothetical protein n=1 Tax=Amycolatopsis sp. NBC_00438 TaxID=2903558 RepID=UPI002E228650